MKGDFYIGTSTNGTGPHELARVLAEHFTNLSGSYRHKGMDFEADAFLKTAEELNQIKKELEELNQKQQRQIE